MTCEICDKNSDMSRVCSPCEGHIDKSHRASLKARAEKWALSHKCRKCNQGLALNRYFNCTNCVQLETSDDWDGFDDHDFDAKEVDLKNSAQEKATRIYLHCKKCRQTKHVKEFNASKFTKTKHESRCKPCNAKMSREYREKRAS